MQCYIGEYVAGISSSEVVPFFACHKLVLGTFRNGATLDVRNPQHIPSNRNNRVPVLSGAIA
ncbi:MULTISPECIES: hypothetical protein [Clostridium]|uniref:hypothetical protein n=1 Tax=Clostridium TaxID=1485 RepID=UPI00041C4F2E|nr:MULTISPECIES: hypothetical protein [Clostridium]MBN7575188.1 hypothetical protein [Clostridium beijerinckii]MBN7580491.1 hypothetical protein [Clostridium beijerinckii]MBN7584952.1 hypothetical protein [Clostridium beijerinckii]MBO0520554.1 hypothetical protein [Clostridium beijerinckii]MZK50532.1 hypothetical protein [Clostridium beijerinckii]